MIYETQPKPDAIYEEIYSVYDEKAKSFSSIFTSKNKGTAIRIFEQTVNNPNEKNMLATYPADYTLCRLGKLDFESGHLFGSHEKIIRADEVLKHEKQ